MNAPIAAACVTAETSVGAVGIGVTTASNIVPNTVFYGAGNVEVFKIGSDGRLFWRGREVETDDELRAAMREVNELLRALVTVRHHHV